MNTSAMKKEEERMEVIKLDSPKLGEVEYREEDIISLGTPLLGFPDLNDFLLIANDKTYPFMWFQSTEDVNICFILIEPEVFFQDYKPNIPQREQKVLGIREEKDQKLFGIVVVPDDPKRATVNLRAPLVVNLTKKIAKQVILEDDKLSIKTPLFAR